MTVLFQKRIIQLLKHMLLAHIVNAHIILHEMLERS